MNSRSSDASASVRKGKKPSGSNLERLYFAFNRPEYIHPDPLELVRRFEDPRDREIAALLASALAYGRVGRILFSGNDLLERMGNRPFEFLVSSAEPERRKAFAGFRHRFHSGEDIACLLGGVRRALEEYGSLGACFAAGFSPEDSSVCEAEKRFSEYLCSGFAGKRSTLLPSPEEGSACKRLNLMLRWLVRKDAVDPGGWTGIPASKLVVPLDTHMHRLALSLGFTKRKAADLRTALEITKAFARYAPDDPVRYDFPLTRFGIHPDFPETPEDDTPHSGIH